MDLGAFLTWQALAMFVLGVLLSAMAKGLVGSVKSKVSGG